MVLADSMEIINGKRYLNMDSLEWPIWAKGLTIEFTEKSKEQYMRKPKSKKWTCEEWEERKRDETVYLTDDLAKRKQSGNTGSILQIETV